MTITQKLRSILPRIKARNSDSEGYVASVLSWFDGCVYESCDALRASHMSQVFEDWVDECIKGFEGDDYLDFCEYFAECVDGQIEWELESVDESDE